MFIGDYNGNMDAKGRLIIPSQFRKNCEGELRFILKKNIYDQALDLYPYKSWINEMETFRSKLNLYDKTHNTLLREYCRGTAEVSIDRSGRILLPKTLIEYAQIDKKVIIAGAGDKIVIWSKVIYESVALPQNDFEEILAKTLGNGE